MSAISKDQIKAYLASIQAIADAIREAKQIPAGHLYAIVQSVMSLDAFERTIGILTDAKLVKRDQSHLLHWIGPA